MRCCSSRANEREPHAASTPQNLEMTDAHVRARAHPCHRGCVSPLSGSTQPRPHHKADWYVSELTRGVKANSWGD